MERRYLRTPEAAVYCCLSRRTLEALRVRGGGPIYLRPPGRRVVLYAIEDLDAWLHSGRRQSTSDLGAGGGISRERD